MASAEPLPVLISRHAASQRLQYDARKVQDLLGLPDLLARVSWRTDPAWHRSRIHPMDNSPWLDDADCGRTLYSKFEAGRLAGIHSAAMAKRLQPVAYLLNAHRRLSYQDRP
jgi:hypothetical protein